MRKTGWAVIGIALLGLCGIAARAGEPAGAPGARLAEPGYLSETARQALHTKMSAHASDMRSLLEGVLRLRREEIRAAAQRILDEPRIARPTGGSDANAMLPERYFVLQDRLRDRARALAELTQHGTDQQLAAAFAGVIQTCVECHSSYLRGAR